MDVTFVIAGFITVASAVAAISLRNLVHCALSLAVTFAGLAALFLNLNAQFVGLVQILIYIGAVAILIVFAILLTRESEPRPPGRWKSPSAWMGIVIALLAFGTLAAAVVSSVVAQRPSRPPPPLPVAEIGHKLMTNYVLPLEVMGLLLTAALIGAVLIALREKTGP